ncbi:hypothetical protein [Photobacterium swingsii]
MRSAIEPNNDRFSKKPKKKTTTLHGRVTTNVRGGTTRIFDHHN